MFRNKRRLPAAAFTGGLVALVALAGCKKEPSMASKSAAAFQEAQKRGETLGGGAHGGHVAMTPGGGQEMPGTPPENRSAADHSGMAMGGMDHSKMDHSKMPMKGMDHSGMDHSKMAMGGMDHSKMDHSRMAMEGMDHPSAAPVAVPVSETASPGQPAATLRPDALDAPAPTAVADARRAAEMAGEMKGMSAHGQGTYRQVDAGRGPGVSEGSEKPPSEPVQRRQG